MIRATEDGNSLDGAATVNLRQRWQKGANQNENMGMSWNLEPFTPVKTQGKVTLEAGTESLLAFRESCFLVSREVADGPSELP